MRRGDRTPEVDENRRTTVGVDLHNHTLKNGTECKIYDVAGQVMLPLFFHPAELSNTAITSVSV